jgi:hypothetical protein
MKNYLIEKMREKPFVIPFVSGRDTGKSFFTSHFLISLKNVYHKILYFSNTIHLQKDYMKFYKKYFGDQVEFVDVVKIKNKLRNSGVKNASFDYILKKYYDEVYKVNYDAIQNGEEMNQILFIIDDCLDQSNDMRNGVLSDIPSQCRHLGLSILVLVQRATMLSPSFYTNSDFVFFFELYGKKDKILMQEKVTNFSTLKEFEKSMEVVFKEKYDIYIIYKKEPNKFYRNFIEVSLSNNE